MMLIRFWGVRGSCAAAGAATAGVGGNTSCVEVRCDDTLIVCDAGTGLRELGARLGPAPVEAHLLLSHFHWDHIQGFPFFAPAYRPGCRVDVYGPERAAGRGGDVRAALEAQMRAPHFPVGLEAMRAELGFHPVPAGGEWRLGPARVRAAAANHPNGCLAYRIEHGGKSAVYATDTEHREDGAVDAGLVELARGADLLIYDAQYTADEYAGRVGLCRRGWGHSTPDEAARLAEAAGVGQLVLFHHDPSHDDRAIAAMEAAARARFPRTTAAREGLELRLDPRPAGRRA